VAFIVKRTMKTSQIIRLFSKPRQLQNMTLNLGHQRNFARNYKETTTLFFNGIHKTHESGKFKDLEIKIKRVVNIFYINAIVGFRIFIILQSENKHFNGFIFQLDVIHQI